MEEGEGVIAYHTVALATDIARVLIEQMTDVVLLVAHEHEGDDSHLSAGTRREVALATATVFLDGSDEVFHTAALDGSLRAGVYLIGIVVSGVVREVAADDEEVVVVEIGLELFRHLHELLEVVGRYDDRHNRGDRFSE